MMNVYIIIIKDGFIIIYTMMVNVYPFIITYKRWVVIERYII